MTATVQCWKKMLLALLALFAFFLSNTEAYVVICRDYLMQNNTINDKVVIDIKVPGLNLDPKLCTHYSYKTISISSSYLIEADPTPDIIVKAIQEMKTKNPNLKILVQVFGLNYMERLGSTKEMTDLANSLNAYLRANAFDGVELLIDGTEIVKGLVQTVTKTLKESLTANKFTLSIYYTDSVLVDNYNIAAFKNSTDFAILPTMNLIPPTISSDFASHPHPLKSDDPSVTTVDRVVAFWTARGYPADKMVITVPTEGQIWELTSTVTRPPAPATEDFMNSEIDYRDICQLVKNKGWQKFQDTKNQTGPYIVSPTNSSPRYWVGYDDSKMASLKAEYIKTKNLLGAHVLISSDVSVNSSDDYDNSCGDGFYPITTAVAKALMSPTVPVTTVTPGPTKTTPKMNTTTLKPGATNTTVTSPTSTKLPRTQPTTPPKPKTTQKPTTTQKATKTTKITAKPATTKKN